jgi:hypothetical protein
MASQNVIQLKTTKNTPATRRSTRVTKAIRRQTMAAAGIGLVAVTLIGLSLKHQAHGVTIIADAPLWEGAAMAVGIEIGYVAMELSQILATTDKVRKQIAKFARPAILATMLGSALLNTYAFTEHAANYWTMGAGTLFGFAIPTLVYVLTRIGAPLYIDSHSRG